MYSEEQKQELSRAIGEYFVDQLLWRVLYLNGVASNWEGSEEIRKKLTSLPNTFRLIIDNIERTPEGKDLADAVTQETQDYVQYIDCEFQNCTSLSTLNQKWNRSIERVINSLARIYSEWSPRELEAIINHQRDLFEKLTSDIKNNKYSTLIEIVPIIRRLSTDIANYLSQGFIEKGPSGIF